MTRKKKKNTYQRKTNHCESLHMRHPIGPLDASKMVVDCFFFFFAVKKTRSSHVHVMWN